MSKETRIADHTLQDPTALVVPAAYHKNLVLRQSVNAFHEHLSPKRIL